MDPIADKILVLSSFISFVELGVVQSWMVIVIVMREAVITALRALALAKGSVVAADMAGKQKTISQVLSIFVILVFLLLREGGSRVFGFWSDVFEARFGVLITVLMVITVIFTITSGASFLIKNRSLYANEKKD
jgi:CDP-diacylglycerol--glycerol-3-phosphate 3-phosphatidyltransferase